MEHERRCGAPLPAPKIEILKSAVAERGERAVRDRLRLSRPTLARALAGLSITLGTHALVDAAIGSLDTPAITFSKKGAVTR